MIWEDEETGAIHMDRDEYDLIVKKIKDLEDRVYFVEKELE
jgi:tetrahydromethanopterin S-methyltransferase subunit G